MAALVSKVEELAGLIQPEKIENQGFPRPERVTFSEGADHSGDPAFYVNLVYPDETPDEVLSWNSIKTAVRWIRDQNRRVGGEEHWTYMRILRSSDQVSAF